MILNKTNIEKLEPPATGYAIHWDDNTKGFGLRVTATGVKSFIVQQRIKGKEHRITIGRYGALTAEAAKKEAKKLIGDIAKGTDPVAEKQKEKLQNLTLAQALDSYLEFSNLKPRTVTDMRYAFEHGLSDWMKKPVNAITTDLVTRRHKELGKKSAARGNLTMRYLRAVIYHAMKAFTGADGTPLITVNAVKHAIGKKQWHRVERRQTHIQPHQLTPWWKAVDEQGNPTLRDYFQFVLLTGVRRTEASLLKWGQVDLKGKTFTILDPKNRHDHTLPLSDFLFDMLTRRKASAVNEYVFTDDQGRRPANPQKAQARIEEMSEVSFCIHDLRRTFATIAESLDIPGYALKKLLNHSTGSDVTGGYLIINTERLREPMQKITDYILRAAGVKETAAVIDINQARG